MRSWKSNQPLPAWIPFWSIPVISVSQVDHCLGHDVLPYINAGRDTHNQALKKRFVEPAPLPDATECVSQMKYRLKNRDGRVPYADEKTLSSRSSTS
jgi:hypothetical protein